MFHPIVLLEPYQMLIHLVLHCPACHCLIHKPWTLANAFTFFVYHVKWIYFHVFCTEIYFRFFPSCRLFFILHKQVQTIHYNALDLRFAQITYVFISQRFLVVLLGFRIIALRDLSWRFQIVHLCLQYIIGFRN